jgi:hypothetical protein
MRYTSYNATSLSTKLVAGGLNNAYGQHSINVMIRIALLTTLLLLTACEESTQPLPVPAKEKKVFEKNAIDAAGVAKGDEQVSPFGKPSH